MISAGKLAKLAKDSGTTSAVSSELIAQKIGVSHAVAEGLIHEICHAVVFKVKEFQLHELGGIVSSCFEVNYDRQYDSDLSECRALAVELLVFRHLGWAGFFPFLVKSASIDMHAMTEDQAMYWVYRTRMEKTSQKRADEVLEILEALCAAA